MILNTKNFGEIEIDESKIIKFNDGIPGFVDLKNYVLIYDEDEKSPFYWLQSIDDTEIAFVMINMFNFMKDYSPLIEEEELKVLGKYDSEDDIFIYNIVVIPNDIKKMSVNLKAPVIINTKTNKGKQFIANNEDYSIKYYLYEEITKNKNEAGE